MKSQGMMSRVQARMSHFGLLVLFLLVARTGAGCSSSSQSVGTPQPFVKIDHTDGHPDGPTVDSEGCLWIALYAGWEARRYSPAGELVGTVRFPVANITKLAFGESDFRSVFATTARQLVSPAAIAKQPLIGSLFELRSDVPGVPCPLVRL